MSKSTVSAADWVRELPRGARIHWAEVEAHVFHDHPPILRLLGPAADDVRLRGRAFSLILGVLVVVACLVGMAIVWAPIWGLATLAGDAWGVVDVDGTTAIPVAGIAMLVSCLVHLTLLVRRVWSGGVGGTDDASIADGTLILGTLTLIGMVVIGVRQQPEGWQWWLVPAVLGLVLATVNRIAARQSREVAGPFSKKSNRVTPQLPDWRERMRAAVAALTPLERDALKADQDRAIEILRRVGTITPDQAYAASRVELGMLSISLGAG